MALNSSTIDWLFKLGLLVAIVGGAGGWYHWNVTRPAGKVKTYENVTIPALKTEITDLKKNISDKDALIKAARVSSDSANKLCSSVSAQCKTLFAVRKKEADAVAAAPLPPIEGTGPDIMNQWFKKHYSEE